jgi:hypothetical protein
MVESGIDDRRFKRCMPIHVAERYGPQRKRYRLRERHLVISANPAGRGERLFSAFVSNGGQFPDENVHGLFIDRRAHDPSARLIAQFLEQRVRAISGVRRTDHLIPEIPGLRMG